VREQAGCHPEGRFVIHICQWMVDIKRRGVKQVGTAMTIGLTLPASFSRPDIVSHNFQWRKIDDRIFWATILPAKYSMVSQWHLSPFSQSATMNMRASLLLFRV
jgi:hypothetical protein